MRQRGFTLLEVLVALGIMAIGLIGILALQKGAASASGYSRRATEAAILGEDELEKLRTVAVATITSGSDQVDSDGVASASGLFIRTWTVTAVDGVTDELAVTVTWSDNNGAHSLSFRTLRNTN